MYKVWLFYEVEVDFKTSRMSDWKVVDMFTWGKHLIKVINNFANKEELEILDSYLGSIDDPHHKHVSWLDFIDGEHDLENQITDPEVARVMRELNDRTYKYITEVYFPEAELSILKDKGSRGLELIRWRRFAELPAHADWRLPDGSPYPLTLPAFALGTLIYINKDYSGGAINFPEYDFKLDPQPGDLILFPCQYLHEVTRVGVLEGKDEANRYTMPVFYWFDLEAKES